MGTRWMTPRSFTSNHAECGLAYRIQHHHLAQLTMRLVKLCVCGRNSLSRPLFRCQCLQQLSCTSLPLQMHWHHSQWQVSEVRHSSQMAIVSGSSSRSHWHRPTSIGTGLVYGYYAKAHRCMGTSGTVRAHSLHRISAAPWPWPCRVSTGDRQQCS